MKFMKASQFHDVASDYRPPTEAVTEQKQKDPTPSNQIAVATPFANLPA